MTNSQVQNSCVEFDAVVVGAGIAGLYMLHRLRSLGLRVRVYEAGDGVGGTWYWNRYPGARCDVESLEYSYSFSKELQQEWRWSSRYAEQPEILKYLNHVAERFGLLRDIQFETRVLSQTFDDATSRWIVKTSKGDVVSAQFCVMASGNLSTPKFPEIPGLGTFKGTAYHTGMWPKEGVDFTGKRVALLGTGATGVQMVPRIAEQATQLYVFQRTANFSVPAAQRTISDEEDQRYKTDYDKHRVAALQTTFGMSGFPAPVKSALQAAPDEREAMYEKRWDLGGNINYLSSYTDLLTDKEANETASEFARRKIRSIVKDPKTAEALCPDDHPIGTKRLCVDTGYYEAYNRPNVALVDLKVEPIEEITERGVRTAKAEYEVDAIAFATGFDAMTGAMLAIDIRGKCGLELKRKWSHGPLTYLGIMTSGFPNLFVITGPGSPSVKTNMFRSIEQHVDWIADCIGHLHSRRIARIEPTEQAEADWVAHVNEVADATLYPLAKSWYTGDNVPGKPRIFMPYVGGIPNYRKACDESVAKGYAGFVLSGETADMVQPAAVRRASG